MQTALLVPVGELRCPVLQVGPHQVAEGADLLLGVELGAQVEEVQEGPQAEAHHEVLAVVERQDAAGVLLGIAGREQVAVALGGGASEIEIDRPLFDRVVILLALAVAVVAHGPQIEHFFQF